MDVIREIVTTIIIILVLAALLEMILPSNNMQRFVRVIMGLFIIITLLNPLVGFLDKDLGSALTNWKVIEHEEQLQTILARGKAISEGSTEKALLEYETRLGQQIISLIRLANNSVVTEAKVKVNKGGQGSLTGDIEEVVLYIGTSGQEQKQQDDGMVEPVVPIELEIDAQEGVGQVRDPTVEVPSQIIETITNFYGIQKEQIKIRVAE